MNVVAGGSRLDWCRSNRKWIAQVRSGDYQNTVAKYANRNQEKRAIF